VEAQQVPVIRDVVVIGAGFGGVCAGIKLREAGITNFVILEKADDDPGAGRDVTSLSFAPNTQWTRMYAKRREILDVTEDSGLDGHIRFGREVVSSVFDDATDTWTLTTRNGETYHARVVIAATGPLHVPFIPNFPGRNDFRGLSFHSAQWDHGFDPAGKRIAVIGTGASAAQFIPQLAKTAASLTVFQPTPPRVIPNPDRPITRAERWLFRNVPGVHKAYHYGARQLIARAHLRRQDHRPNVELVTADIERITESGIRTVDGVDHEVDAIVYGTGFAMCDRIGDETLVGAGGLTIQRAWRDGMEAYLGVALHGFPNYFLITNSGGGHPSIMFVIEAHVHYILRCLQLMERASSTRIEVRRSAQRLFNDRIHAKLEDTVWNSGGCHSWYRDAWPGSSVSYWRQMREPVPSAFDLTSGAGADDDVYDGPATIRIGGDEHAPRVRLTGHLDPIDGRYHWQGTVFDALPDYATQPVTVTIGERTAHARITEHTPWGSYSVAGVGAPPFDLKPIELMTLS
jgi:cation diffusion facilitator CzcD-associated flavoprotein CzcO